VRKAATLLANLLQACGLGSALGEIVFATAFTIARIIDTRRVLALFALYLKIFAATLLH
jgi:hypothetical protein